MAAERLEAAARLAVGGLVAPEGRVDGRAMEQEQYAAHGYAWLATYVAGLRETLHWAERLDRAGQLRELERLILQAAFGEYLQQMLGGIPISQGGIFGVAIASCSRRGGIVTSRALISATLMRLNVVPTITASSCSST